MKISLIAVIDQNRLISHNNKIPWHLPNDIAYFKKLTYGKPVIMGSKTYQSIGKPLVNRRNIVLSFNQNLKIPGCEVYTNYKDAIRATSAVPEVMIIGGASIYKLFLPMAQTIYLTLIHASFEFSDHSNNLYFPELTSQDWQEQSSVDNPKDANNSYPHSFIVLQRLTPLS
jgi:dihydrofolate reductase